MAQDRAADPEKPREDDAGTAGRGGEAVQCGPARAPHQRRFDQDDPRCVRSFGGDCSFLIQEIPRVGILPGARALPGVGRERGEAGDGVRRPEAAGPVGTERKGEVYNLPPKPRQPEKNWKKTATRSCARRCRSSRRGWPRSRRRWTSRRTSRKRARRRRRSRHPLREPCAGTRSPASNRGAEGRRGVSFDLPKGKRDNIMRQAKGLNRVLCGELWV